MAKMFRICLSPSGVNIVLIQIVTQNLSTKEFVPLFCLQGAFTTFYLAYNEIHMWHWTCHKETASYVHKITSEREPWFLEQSPFLWPVLPLLPPLLWLTGHPDQGGLHFFSSLPAFFNHSRKVIWKLTVRKGHAQQSEENWMLIFLMQWTKAYSPPSCYQVSWEALDPKGANSFPCICTVQGVRSYTPAQSVQCGRSAVASPEPLLADERWSRKDARGHSQKAHAEGTELHVGDKELVLGSKLARDMAQGLFLFSWEQYRRLTEGFKAGMRKTY